MNFPSDKMVRVDVTYLDGDELVRLSLEGEDAKRWYEMNEEVKRAAESRNANPDWSSLPWKVRREKVEG